MENSISTKDREKTKRHFLTMKEKKIKYGNHIIRMDDEIIIRSMIKTR